MSVASTCPKCKGAMVQGHSVEFTSANILVGFWIEGPARKSWLGAQVPPEEARIPIAHFRCSSCGFLESYARSEFAAK